VNKESIKLSDVMAECQFMISMLASQKSIEFQIDVDNLCPEVIFTDANRLKQILNNLLSNSVKFTQEGHVRLCVQPSITDHLNFMVSDTGVGIKEDDLPNLFNQFTMFGDRSLNPNGSGFGLYISNLLLQSLGSEKM
jgi:signal transduction histidine kinase